MRCTCKSRVERAGRRGCAAFRKCPREKTRNLWLIRQRVGCAEPGQRWCPEGRTLVWQGKPIEQGHDPCYRKDETVMAKVTSKYQVTVPRMIADRYNIRPGDEIDWVAAGEVIRVIPGGKDLAEEDRESRLRLFDQATQRHQRRSLAEKAQRSAGDKGWTREGLYGRGRSR